MIINIMNSSSRSKITKITYISLSVAILTICSWITIPIGIVPFTMQTFAVSLLIIVLGKKHSSIALLIYLLLGLVGVPVFAGFSGGITPFLAPTGGFLIGFFPMIIVSGILLGLIGKKGRLFKIIAVCVGTLCCYLCGVFYTCALYLGEGQGISIGSVLMITVVPYMIPDIIKNVAAVYIGEKIQKVRLIQNQTLD